MVTETTKNSTDMIELLKKYGFTKDETALTFKQPRQKSSDDA